MLAILFPFSLGLVSVDFSLKVRVRVERVENSRRKADWALVIPVTWKGLPRWHWRWRARPRAQETREGGPGSGRPSTRGTGGSGSGRPSTRETGGSGSGRPSTRDGWTQVGKTLHPREGGPGSGRPPEEGLATRFRICLENPRMEEPGGGSPQGRREWDPTERLSAHTRCERCWNPLSQTSVAFAALSPGPPQALLTTGPGGSCSWGHSPQPCPPIVPTGVRSPSVTRAIWSMKDSKKVRGRKMLSVSLEEKGNGEGSMQH